MTDKTETEFAPNNHRTMNYFPRNEPHSCGLSDCERQAETAETVTQVNSPQDTLHFHPFLQRLLRFPSLPLRFVAEFLVRYATVEPG